MKRETFDDLPFEGEPAVNVGDKVFVPETGRNHLVWTKRESLPVVLINGGFHALDLGEFIPLVSQ